MSNGMLGGVALADIAGPIGDLLEKLGGADGQQWLEALKRFLRKEEVWPRLAEDVRTDRVMRVITHGQQGRQALLSVLQTTVFFRRREAEILKLYFGLDDGRERTLEDVGRILGVTRERVRQIKERALRRFGRMLALGAFFEFEE